MFNLKDLYNNALGLVKNMNVVVDKLFDKA